MSSPAPRPQTMAEKILSQRGDRTVYAGDLAVVEVDQVMVVDSIAQSFIERMQRDLAAVGVTRDLKVDSRAHRMRNLLGLMRKEEDRQCAVGSRESSLQVRAVSVHSRRLRGGIVHPGDDEPVTSSTIRASSASVSPSR